MIAYLLLCVVVAALVVGGLLLERRDDRRWEAERAVRVAAARAAITRPANPLDAFEEDAWRQLTTDTNNLEP
ncbi:hypothetical protein [Streptacidiphilus sp. EB103A]|uniref:hypothetical protein n=1 Tax=Streptacidiphilus sp. EB103A TaxID=3156275 RepID=UPI003512359F